MNGNVVATSDCAKKTERKFAYQFVACHSEVFKQAA